MMTFFTQTHRYAHSLLTASRKAALLLLIAALVSCGGGGGGGDGPPTPPVIGSAWQSGVFQSASTFANRCAVPRTGNDAAGDPVPDVQGTSGQEKNFLRSWSNDTYLWYDEIVDRNPNGADTVAEYFELLVTNATTASGSPKDNFHFSMPSDDYIMLSQSGVSAGYGANWVITNNTPPRELIVAFPEPGSPADVAGLQRGDRIITVDGADLEFGNDVDTLNGGLFPEALGEVHQFVVRDLSNATRTITMTSEAVTSTPVPIATTIPGITPGTSVGYILFNDHIITAEDGLVDAIEQLSGDDITDLVLDLRYNGGGYLYIASQLAYMIAGPAQTNGETFEDLVFNDKHLVNDPVTGDPLTPTPFYNITSGRGALPANQSLPFLGLTRVFVLTGSNTCSASESIINSLRGVDVEVIQIGSTTCGKPYGFYPEDNCGETYFTIQFQGENAKGFGEYPDGFKPQNAGGLGVAIPGCSVRDDFAHQLGDPNELRLQTALNYDTFGCPTASGAAPGAVLKSLTGTSAASDGKLVKPLPLQGRIMER